MAKYALQDLLRVRDHRKDHAQEVLLKAKKALVEAQKFLQEQKDKLAAYIKKKPEFIQRIFDQGMQKVQFKRNYLDLMHLKISKLDECQMKLAIAVEKAQNKCEEAQQNVTRASELLNKAILEKSKIEEHKKIWLEEVRILDELEQDKELEDFKTKAKDEN